MTELKIDIERVRKAAASCPDAKKVLETLFPEAFKDDTIVVRSDVSAGKIRFFFTVGDSYPMKVEERLASNLMHKGLFLQKPIKGYHWAVVSDDTGESVLTLVKG